MPDPGDGYLPLLLKAGCEPGVIAHCRVVRDVAVSIVDKIITAGKVTVDRDLVAAGAILHDIGRSRSHGMDHADLGGDICRSLGLDHRICLIVERHIGAGLTSEERIVLGLVGGDRVPVAIEEKIIAHADNLVKGTRIITRKDLEHSIERFPLEVRARFIVLADELESLSWK
ncbi:MAG TPA: HDIG domain-containing protein [Methanospirillum sp.]|nr:HDIG domain-containing protein [Methanospirillum sp.]